MHTLYSPDLAPYDYYLFLSLANYFAVKNSPQGKPDNQLPQFLDNRYEGFYYFVR